MKGKAVLNKVKIIIWVCLCTALIIVGFILYGKAQMAKIPRLTFKDALEYTLKGKKDALVTVGVIKEGKISWKVYGNNGQEQSKSLHTYEIGSLTKTFTAALIQKAVNEGKLDLNATIDSYLPLLEGRRYPSIKALITHTSGYKEYYFEAPMIANFLENKNSFRGISQEAVLSKAKKLNMHKESNQFEYSNYGYAILGLVLESVYKSDYTTLLNDFVENDLNMVSTKISEKDGDLNNYWDWEKNDAYIPAGAMTSNIEDMLRYAQMQLDKDPLFMPCHESLKQIDVSRERYMNLGIHMDEIGMSWIIDKENGFIWHNGGTGHYNSYLGFCPNTETAVVILSNLSPNDRIPATVLGIKLLQEING